MSGINVLIADDSVVYRNQIRSALSACENINIVGAASNGRLALERLAQTPTDLLILDLEMPEMDGLQVLSEIARLGMKTKVLVFSSHSKRGTEIALEALRLGAMDFVTKPDASSAAQDPHLEPQQKIRNLLEPKIRVLLDQVGKPLVMTATKTEWISPNLDLFRPDVIVIGSSTGGPRVLEELLENFHGRLRCPILIVQHMPPVFTTSFGERLQKLSGLPVAEAVHGETLGTDRIYIAPGDYHLRLKKGATRITVELDRGAQVNSVRPAVDPLFESAADVFGSGCLGIVLTGMGADGRVGAEALKNAGGTVIIQSQETCVVFGMPGAVMDAGAFDHVMSPAEIRNVLLKKAGEGAT